MNNTYPILIKNPCAPCPTVIAAAAFVNIILAPFKLAELNVIAMLDQSLPAFIAA